MTDNNHSPKNWRRFFLGSYTPPEFILIGIRFFSDGAFSALAGRVLSPVKNCIRTHRALSFSLLGIFLAAVTGATAYRFYESRKPQPIHIDVSVHTPKDALCQLR
jgi:hypothetical protein